MPPNAPQDAPTSQATMLQLLFAATGRAWAQEGLEGLDPRPYYRPELTPTSKVMLLREALAKIEQIAWLLRYAALRQQEPEPVAAEGCP